MNQAWDLLFEGKINEAKKLVSETFSLETCKDYSLLNLMGYIKLFEKDYKEALLIYQNYLEIAISSQDKENEHIGYHQLAMVYREMNDYQTALNYIDKEREIIEKSFPEDALKYSVNNYEQGYLRLKLREIVEAFMYMEQSLKQALQTDDLIAQACAYRGLGEIGSIQNSEESHENFLQAIALFEKAGDQIGAQEVRNLLNNIK
ncbi:tetratricopeptide repeat protein [Streptococcus oralis]|uniref:tetratricopeptide repeat protein n=1 Tax=Streptococcus oralis TaxID=1303 RepID=UPI00203AA211|nr:tetratricopeptide repeat protein [Streptococcus oralis]MCM3309303.1 tetratricopeptide repeat protein [Streptococcus oralis]